MSSTDPPTPTPLVSVCIPSYNAARHIVQCIESVLDQGIDSLELILSDDESTDGTWELAQGLLTHEPRATLVRQSENRGAAENWNVVLERATGRYVKLLCSDDYLLPGALAAQIAALDRHPSAVLATGRRRVVDDLDRILVPAIGLRRPLGVVPGGDAIRRMVRHGGNPFGEPSAVLLRRDAFEQVGRFDGSWRYVIDLSGYARVLEEGDLVVVDRLVSAFRVWPDSWSTRLARTQASETRRFLRGLREAGTGGVTRLDVMRGVVAATVRRQGRTAVRWRSRRRR